jgi:ABC-2 type transport system permease protein
VSVALVQARYQALELLRYPAASVPMLFFPALFFVFFGLSAPAGQADFTLASFAAFAVLGIAFFQFGVGIAADRASPWERFLRTLPVGAGSRFAARVLTALVFAFLAAVVVVAVAVAATPVSLGPLAWLRLAAVLSAGSVPFALLGIAIGYWSAPKAALPLANVLYLALSYAGGLWTRPAALPHAVQRISVVLPTRAWGELLWASVAPRPWPAFAVLELAAAGVLFAILALLGYRRDEGQRYT